MVQKIFKGLVLFCCFIGVSGMAEQLPTSITDFYDLDNDGDQDAFCVFFNFEDSPTLVSVDNVLKGKTQVYCSDGGRLIACFVENDNLRDKDVNRIYDAWEWYWDAWQQENLDDYQPLADNDFDGDGADNLLEFLNRTNPYAEDSDSDMIGDLWEIINGLHPNDASDAELDVDQNGMTNLEEYLLAKEHVPIYLVEGWNLVSVKAPQSLELSQHYTYTYIFAWDNQQKSYATVDLSALLRPNKGYWVYISNVEPGSGRPPEGVNGLLIVSGYDSYTTVGDFTLYARMNDYGAGNAFCSEIDSASAKIWCDANLGYRFSFWSLIRGSAQIQDMYSSSTKVTLFSDAEIKANVRLHEGILDSDEDGMPDVFEIENRFDPWNPDDANLDEDQDMVTNLDEFRHSCNPNVSDTDADGMSDYSEIINRLVPYDASDAQLDPDEDGVKNLQEVLAGSLPFGVKLYKGWSLIGVEESCKISASDSLSEYGFSWAGSSYRDIRLSTPLNPYVGYWIYANEDIELDFRTGRVVKQQY